jgi:hypothetical protein
VAYVVAQCAGSGQYFTQRRKGRPRADHTTPAMNTTYSDFAATLASIRTDLTELAFDKSKADRGVMMRAAAALAMFESDMLRKAAGPILPGEPLS